MVSDVTGANNAVTIGQGDTAIMVAADAQPKVAVCDPAKILHEHQCAGLRILVVNATKMPFIARNTRMSWATGSPHCESGQTIDKSRRRVPNDLSKGIWRTMRRISHGEHQ